MEPWERTLRTPPPPNHRGVATGTEAAYRRVAFQDVWSAPETENDVLGFFSDCLAAGIDDSEEIEARIESAFAWFSERVNGRQDVEDAFNALGQRIRKPGRIPGPTVANIIRRAMGR